MKSFEVFYRYIFAESIAIVEGKYTHGRYVQDWCRQMQTEKKSAREGPRKHQKSTIFHGFIMWRIFRLHLLPKLLWEGCYLSYKSDLAEAHLNRINLYISVNPWFQKRVIKTTEAENLIEYQLTLANEKKIIRYKPEGMMSFKRGQHYDEVLVDDPLRDPANALNLTQIQKVTQVFRDEVASLPKEGGSLHVTGTRQDAHDLFWMLQTNDQYAFHSCPAEIDPTKKLTLWPELMPWNRLKEIEKEIGNKSYQKEYLCKPVRNVEGFFVEDDLKPAIKKELQNVNIDEPRPTREGVEIIAGYDIGKKRHPSHVVVYEKENIGVDERQDPIYKLTQLLSLWFDGVDYTAQVPIVKKVVENLKVDEMLYDNTRGELETLAENGELPEVMKPVVFTPKMRRGAATQFEKQVTQGLMQMIDDERQTRQILNCDNNLNSADTAEGHGDSFWSNALACYALTGAEPRLRWV